MTTLRAVVADDEAPARRALCRALAQVGDVEVVGEAQTAAEALALVRSHAPDVLFLDIRMPGGSGLDAAAALRGTGGPAVVFVTAFDTHAVEAFEHAAVDYLLKPLDVRRVAESVRRVREAGGPRLDEVDPAAVREVAAGRSTAALLRVAGRLQVVERDAVRRAEAAGNYVRLHGEGRSWLVRDTITHIVEQFGGALVRVHRSHAVRLRDVHEVLRPDGNDPTVRLRDGTEVPVGRTWWPDLRRRLESGR